ncbi:hypothetical protein ACFY1J_44350 [Streptomyces sp. NPDC001406]|uniref:hypothetical protein n=1 Tax=Streptomyces sp. NPDC001406 TaxID=3364572 RepID=UPI00367AA71F
MDALDTWRNGSPAKATRILQHLLDPKQQVGTGGFVPPELIRLFHGHAAEVQAAGETGTGRQKLLEAARADYLAISKDSPAGRRAALSLQFNAYLRALGPTPNCKPGTVRAGELAQIAQALRALAKDPEFTELGRLKATVNLAQVENCRITAQLVRDDGRVERAVAVVSEAPDLTGSDELRALAESIAALHAAGKGDLAAAIRHIRAAIAHRPNLVEQAIWNGFLARWSLARCDLETGRTAQQEALSLLDAAEQAGRASSKLRRHYEQDFAAKLRKAKKHCGRAR